MTEEPRKKLIEVALPLETINRESAREKSIRHGHPSTLHLWWARRPLAACRAILFASLVDDPSSQPDEFPTEEQQDVERARLFRLIERLVTWEATTDEDILEEARGEILRSTSDRPPPIIDPFCGGGSIPLEAQRLGLEVHGSDLNPVAVLITKAMVEIAPKFADMPPARPPKDELDDGGGWTKARGLAEDVRYYGDWMRARAAERIGDLYPSVSTASGARAPVLAWLWARTVVCGNPACRARTPLVRSFLLATRGAEKTWLEPAVDRASSTVRYEVRTGPVAHADGTKVGKRGMHFRCLFCGAVSDDKHIKAEGQSGRLGHVLLAAVVEDAGKKTFVSGTDVPVPTIPKSEVDRPDVPLSEHPQYMGPPRYGMKTVGELYSDRQVVALNTFSELLSEVRTRVHADLAEDRDGYPEAVLTFLALAVGRCVDYWTTCTVWEPSGLFVAHTFGRNDLPMVSDYAEAAPLQPTSGGFPNAVDWVARAIERLPARGIATIRQSDARHLDVVDALVSTDPPYYAAVPYSDLSDVFYTWLRRMLRDVYPDLFSTVLTPKALELVADATRHGDRRAAATYFEEGMTEVLKSVRAASDSTYPTTIYYAVKQTESPGPDGSSGWERMLESVLNAGLSIDGTWPMRTERQGRLRQNQSNALASSIVLVCRCRQVDAPLATRKEFTSALRAELPGALHHLQQGAIAPVDLAQASIGPGMAVFSRYSKVVEADGEPMRVRTALALINDALDELLAEQEADFDPDTRWCVSWFEQFGMNEGQFGVAETLSRAKNTSVAGLAEAGVLHSAAGKVRLLDREELADAWNPSSDTRLTVWEVTQHLIRRLDSGGEEAAADLLRQVGGLAEPARELAYRLFQICERKKWAGEALAYNSLASSWLDISRLAAAGPAADGEPVQEGLNL